MTTVQSSHGPTEVINARRTESLDAPNILKLVTKATQPQFGLVDVVNIIEKAVLAVTLNNEREEILAHAAFFDYPNVDSVDHAEWQAWLNEHYSTEKCTPLNTLFLHYFVAKPAFAHGSAKEIIRTVFNAVPDIHFLFAVLPAGVSPESALADNFSPMEPKDSAKAAEQSFTVYVCHRHDHCPVLYVRKARTNSEASRQNGSTILPVSSNLLHFSRRMTTIRPFTCDDLFRFNNVNMDHLTETYGIPFYLQYLAHWPEYVQVCEAPDGKIMGYIMGKAEGSVTQETWHGHVTALSVAPEYRRLGLAAIMMNILEEISERKECFFVDLFVRVSNEVATTMYTRLGYTVYRKVLEYYSGDPDEDAYDMRKALSRDTEQKSVVPLKHPVRPEEVE